MANFLQIRNEQTIPLKEIKTQGQIGQGAFGVVYKGLWNGTTDVAVKKMGNNCNAEDFIEEADVMRNLRHPNVVQFHGITVYGRDNIAIIMEYMEGGSLLNIVRTKKSQLSLPRLLNFCSEICAGMSYLHDNDIIHRDLAARNCLVASDTTVKVADFGLTRCIPDDIYYQSAYGVMAHRWAPPEAFERRFTKKVDVWSFGILMWEIYTFGKVPYEELNNHQVKPYIREGNILHKPHGCPEEVYEVMQRCWNYDKNYRPSFDELSHILPYLPSTSADQLTATGEGSSLLRTVAGVGLAALAVGLVASLVTESRNTRRN